NLDPSRRPEEVLEDLGRPLPVMSRQVVARDDQRLDRLGRRRASRPGRKCNGHNRNRKQDSTHRVLLERGKRIEIEIEIEIEPVPRQQQQDDRKASVAVAKEPGGVEWGERRVGGGGEKSKRRQLRKRSKSRIRTRAC